MAFLDLFKEEMDITFCKILSHTVFDCHSIDKTAPDMRRKQMKQKAQKHSCLLL